MRRLIPLRNAGRFRFEPKPLRLARPQPVHLQQPSALPHQVEERLLSLTNVAIPSNVLFAVATTMQMTPPAQVVLRG
jgi:hypothetical protein